MAASMSALQSSLSCKLCSSRPALSHSSRHRHAFLPPCVRSGKLASSRGVRQMKPIRERRKIGTRASAEGETLTSEAGEAEQAATQSDEPVSVAVFPSDMLTMFFKAEGTMDDSAFSKVTSGLEGLEGVSDLKVRVLEGISTVELTKQTTVQATGVASNLLEIIQGAGFKLQTLHLSFEDEEDSAT